MNGLSSLVTWPFISAAFVALPVLVGVTMWWFYRRAFELGSRGPAPATFGLWLLAWFLLTGALGLSGVLARFDLRPPPFGLLIIAIVAASSRLGLSRIGAALATLPFSWLVGLNAFRLPLELVMHRAAVVGLMPAQMSYTGWNFDIVSGATALVLAPFIAAGRAPRALITAWNLLGAALLANILVIAVLSTPVFHAFGNEPGQVNTFVAFFPFVWLPAVLVGTAISFHIIIARALRADSRKRT